MQSHALQGSFLMQDAAEKSSAGLEEASGMFLMQGFYISRCSGRGFCAAGAP